MNSEKKITLVWKKKKPSKTRSEQFTVFSTWCVPNYPSITQVVSELHIQQFIDTEAAFRLMQLMSVNKESRSAGRYVIWKKNFTIFSCSRAFLTSCGLNAIPWYLSQWVHSTWVKTHCWKLIEGAPEDNVASSQKQRKERLIRLSCPSHWEDSVMIVCETVTLHFVACDVFGLW